MQDLHGEFEDDDDVRSVSDMSDRGRLFVSRYGVVKESCLEGSEAENSMADDSESRCSSFDLSGVFLCF